VPSFERKGQAGGLSLEALLLYFELGGTFSDSLTTGLPAKKPAERRSASSSSASQFATGGSGASTKAMKDRARRRNGGRWQTAADTETPLY
jgi:hypothetical protein